MKVPGSENCPDCTNRFSSVTNKEGDVRQLNITLLNILSTVWFTIWLASYSSRWSLLIIFGFLWYACETFQYLRDGGQKAHVLGEACLVFKRGGVVEFVYVSGHTSSFYFLCVNKPFLEGNIIVHQWLLPFVKNPTHPLLRACSWHRRTKSRICIWAKTSKNQQWSPQLVVGGSPPGILAF